MFSLISSLQEREIIALINKAHTASLSDVSDHLAKIIEKIREEIPEKKRISYGRYNIIKSLGFIVYPLLDTIADFSSRMFELRDNDPFIRSLGIQLLSLYGEKTGDLDLVLPMFEKAAMDNDWIVRECSAGFVRKLIKAFPEQMQPWYAIMAKSDNAMQRRFAIESIRPVADNAWFKKSPGFAFSILAMMYEEHDAYPRTSVGNSLSDWMRIDEERTLKIVKKLAKSGNKDSYWIAYRACRNLVKKKPLLVMDILNSNSYKYKERIFHRE